MTTWYRPLQRDRDKRWDYTSSTGSRGAWAIGYCHAWREWTAETITETPGLGPELVKRILADQEVDRRHQAKYHADGHATAHEAEICYAHYRIDNELELRDPPADPASLHKCAICGAFTAGSALFRGGFPHVEYFCDAHRTREHVEPYYLKLLTRDG
jgi:hypothetical protein